MPDAARKLATYADVLAAPPNQVAEILDGELHLSPRPAPPHAWTASSLGGELLPPFQRGRGGPGGWIILDEPELHLDSEIVVPDLAGWRRERMPTYPSEGAFFTLAPDWLCEVLSPRTARIDRVKKLPICARHRVVHVWLLDPLERTLEVLRLDGDTYRVVGLHEGDARVRVEPFQAIELELAALWPESAPAPESGG